MIKRLISLASHLDSKGLTKEADWLDDIINKVSQSVNGSYQRSNPINQPELAPDVHSSDNPRGRLNLMLKALRDEDAANKDKANHDRIIGYDYIAKGFGVGKFIEKALTQWNKENDTKFTSKIERLGVGEGVKITWIEKQRI